MFLVRRLEVIVAATEHFWTSLTSCFSSWTFSATSVARNPPASNLRLPVRPLAISARIGAVEQLPSMKVRQAQSIRRQGAQVGRCASWDVPSTNGETSCLRGIVDDAAPKRTLQGRQGSLKRPTTILIPHSRRESHGPKKDVQNASLPMPAGLTLLKRAARRIIGNWLANASRRMGGKQGPPVWESPSRLWETARHPRTRIAINEWRRSGIGARWGDIGRTDNHLPRRFQSF